MNKDESFPTKVEDGLLVDKGGKSLVLAMFFVILLSLQAHPPRGDSHLQQLQ
jgi:hypothetical protein